MGENQSKLLRDNSKLKKLINECSFCGKKGYKPGILETAHGEYGAGLTVKKYFEELALNNSGVCKACEFILAKNSK